MPSLALATPVEDKDTKSSKNESKLKHHYLWHGQGNIGVAILTNPEYFVFVLSSAAAISESHGDLSRITFQNT